MEQQAKSAIKSMVLKLRHTLEEEIEIQLKRYGFSDKRWRSLDDLPHIKEDDNEIARFYHLSNALKQHLRRIDADPDDPLNDERAQAMDWFVREVSFTHLNRLAALKVLEVRELTPEIITTREAYGGRSKAHYDYRRDHPQKTDQADHALPEAIRHVSRGIANEFKFLFDVGDPETGQKPPANSILWPSYPVLKNCLNLINGLDASAQNPGETLWKEDEIIGWIYQFYNAEEKEEIRSRGRPQLPAEVAVINQFFTPRWIIKYLVDNTLGRLWLEMHPDSDRVREKCDYLVPEPLGGEETNSDDEDTFHPDPDSPINNPNTQPRREPKLPQELRLIDPACGTMHFGHYAFEVFELIYQEAIAKGWAPAPQQGIPAAILENNIYGVDIDLRAVQLAALSLFIKAKSADPEVDIDHFNLVVADAVLPSDGARQEFLGQYADDKVVQDAVRQVLEEMENVAEVGSLLRVEERLRGILGEAGHAAAKSWEAEKQNELPGLEPEERQLVLAEAAGAKPEDWGAHYTVARLLENIKTFAAEAMKTHNLNAQLFAQEAEKTVHLLDVFLNEYDVVVMNPPYGSPTNNGKNYLNNNYPETKNDLYAAFTERSVDLLNKRGFLGALTSRTFLFLSRYDGLRSEIILKKAPLISLVDLGFGVLDDAIVETSAFILRKNQKSRSIKKSVFIRLKNDNHINLENKYKKILESDFKNKTEIFLVRTNDFDLLPKSPFAYWAPKSLLNLFKNSSSLEPNIGIVRAGVSTGNDSRFVRYIWEIENNGSTWKTFSKGGSYSKYYYDFDLVLNFSQEALRIMSSQGNKLANRDNYGKEGLTYPRVTVKGFNVRYFPTGSVFSDKGCCIFPQRNTNLWFLLGFLNTELVQAILLMFTPSRSFEVSHVGALPINKTKKVVKKKISELARTIFDLKFFWDTGNEISSNFTEPLIIQLYKILLNQNEKEEPPLKKIIDSVSFNFKPYKNPELKELNKHTIEVEKKANQRIAYKQSCLDEIIYDLYDIPKRDIEIIKNEIGKKPPEIVWPQMERKSDQEKRKEHVRRLLSYFLLESLKENEDGILPVFEASGGLTAVEAVRQKLADTFGEEAAFHMEGEIKDILGRDIGDWLDGPFIKWHTKLYKRTPIIWQLSSDDYHNTFNCFLYYHKLDSDTLRKVQTQYLWPQKRAVENELSMAQKDLQEGDSGAASRVEEAEETLGILEDFEAKLEMVIEGEDPYKPPKWAEGPIRDGIYDPVIDDGVKVNLMPLQKARILRYKKLI